MLQFHNFPEGLKGVPSPVVTVGTFDGVHLGHRSILTRLREIAAHTGGETMVVTFEPHPRIALGKDTENLYLLNTPEEKAALLDELGIDHLVVIPFTQEFAKQDEHTFIRKYLVEALGTKTLVIGYNHRFGHERGGDFASLSAYGQQYGFHVEEMPRKTAGSLGISSTQIRNALAVGDVELASGMLGYAYPLSGKVGHGDQRGRTIGFPTANLIVENPYKMIPCNGVYAVRVECNGQKYHGMCNIGTRPTFEGNLTSIETHIFDFNKDIYEQPLKMLFTARLRDEQKFSSAEELSLQLTNDELMARQLLESRA